MTSLPFVFILITSTVWFESKNHRRVPLPLRRLHDINEGLVTKN